ncbi:MAG: hypothetical protein KF819_10105 [Labilithrix sp.]|nr:hypothetical protein [Labilithrix sp.]
MTNRIECATHGSSLPTYTCSHLAEGSGLGVAFDEAAPEPWPDAVCDSCASEPPWTDAVARERIQLLCTSCWEDAFGRNTRVPRLADVDAWLHERRARAQLRQQRWLDEYAILSCAHYRYVLDDGEEPWLGFGESEKRYLVMCDPLVIGSWGRRSNTWLWGWSNDHWDARLTQPMIAVKRHGELHGVEPLWRSESDGDEDLAFALAATVLDIVPGIEGVYRAPHENGSLFLAARRTRHVAG